MTCRQKRVKKTLDITEIQPDKRVWEYDGDGTKIYKLDQGYPQKTRYPRDDDDFIGVYHPIPSEAPEHWRKAHYANLAMERAQDPWFKEYWKRVRDYCKRQLT